DPYQDQTTSMDNIVFNHEKGMLDLDLSNEITLSLRKIATMSTTTTPAIKKTIHKRNQYCQIWKLACKATSLAQEVFVMIEQNFIANQEQSRITNQSSDLSTSSQSIDKESNELYLTEMDGIEEFDTITTEPETPNLADIQNPLHV
ncbi:11836_t:CDS:2, partial [Racocetra persica]